MATAEQQRMSFGDYVELLARLHKLMAAGEGDSAEADALRDQMDAPWPRLNETQIALVRGLSADLYSLEGQAAAPAAPTDAFTELLRQLQAAHQRGDWDQALDLVREGQTYLSGDQTAFLRGRFWSELGFRAVAALFFERACALAPGNNGYAYLWLTTLSNTEPERATRLANDLLEHEAITHPQLIFTAANVLLLSARQMAASQGAPLYARLAGAIERAVARAQLLPPDDIPPGALVSALLVLGACHEHLGNQEAALGAYTRALRVAPDHEVALTARGSLWYGERTPEALIDFHRAAEQGTRLVWAYYYLAHHALITRRYTECIQWCGAGLHREAVDAVKADLYEWRAIAAFELRAPLAQAKEDFDRAVQLNPQNQRIRGNRALLQNLTQRQEPVRWTWTTEDEVRRTGHLRLAA